MYLLESNVEKKIFTVKDWEDYILKQINVIRAPFLRTELRHGKFVPSLTFLFLVPTKRS